MSLALAQFSKPTKQRAACNRCHELKSRCTQSNIEPGTCDRCQRLGILCAYSAKSPLGRPKSATMRRANADDGRIGTRRNSENRTGISGKGATLDTLDDASNDSLTIALLSDDGFASLSSEWHISSSSDMDFQTSHDLTKFTIGQLNDGANVTWKNRSSGYGDATYSSPSLDSILDLPSPNFEGDPFDIVNLLSDDRDPPGSTHSHNQVVGGTATAMDVTPSTADLCKPPKTATEASSSEQSTVKRLLDLQLQLQSISTSYKFSDGLAEVLRAVRTLTKILTDVATQRRGSASRNSLPALGCDDGLVILHALTCYMYLLHMFEPMVLSPERQCRGLADANVLTPALSLGDFSLASQPELNVQVTLNLIHLMLRRLHHSVQSLKLEKSQLGRGNGVSGEREGNGRADKMASSMVDAALVGVESMHTIEAAVLRKLESSSRDCMMDEC